MIEGLKQTKNKTILNSMAIAINKCLKGIFGPEVNFALLVFGLNGSGEAWHHVLSNAECETTINALRETADRIEKNQTMSP